MLSNVTERQHPNHATPIWTGERHDGIWFMAQSREELESFSDCKCEIGLLCDQHAAVPAMITWKTPERIA